jgi:hypothetical protein
MHHTAFDEHGNRLPLSEDEIRQTSLDILEQGKLILVVSEIDGALGVNVMGQPSYETLEILKHVTESYRKILYGE